MGRADLFNPQVFMSVVDGVLSTLQSLKLRRVILELPGRLHDRIESDVALRLLKERLDEITALDTLTVVDAELVKE